MSIATRELTTGLAPATAPRPWSDIRLLHLDRSTDRLMDRELAELPSLLSAGDVVVINDAATLPAVLTLDVSGSELRLLGRTSSGSYRAAVFGPGHDRLPTEARGQSPRFDVGRRLRWGTLSAEVTAVDVTEPRSIELRFEQVGEELMRKLYDTGRVVQYAYVEPRLELWDVQGRFASRPWAVEPPSAGLSLSFRLLDELRRADVEVVALTHAAGLSSTGSASFDGRLPMNELSEIPERTARAVTRAKARNRRVLAVGTTVVRALEDRALRRGKLTTGTSETTLVLGPGYRPRFVTGLLTGMHEPSTSHFSLCGAFAESQQLRRAHAHAIAAGYLAHEFGDLCLIL